MKASELIKKLQELKDNNGDLDVVLCKDLEGWLSSDFVEIESFGEQ